MAVEDTVRMEYTGKNLGPVSYRGVSGRVYRGAARSHRFANVLPEDVKTLTNSHHWRVVRRENVAKIATVEDLSEIPAVIDRQKEPELIQAQPAIVEIMPLDISTIAALEMALENDPTLEQLHSALELEMDQEKPRKGVVERLQNAINDFSNTGDL